VPANYPYPEPARSSSYPHIPIPEDPSYYYPPIYAWVSQVDPSFRFPHQNPVYASLPTIRATCSAQLILLDFITRTILGEDYKSISSSLCSFLQSIVFSSLLGPNIPLKTPCSHNLILCSSLNVCDQVSHPYKTTGKIIVLYILIFKFLESKLEDKRFCTE